MVAQSVVLRDEQIRVTSARKRAAAQSGRAAEVASYECVAFRIDNNVGRTDRARSCERSTVDVLTVGIDLYEKTTLIARIGKYIRVEREARHISSGQDGGTARINGNARDAVVEVTGKVAHPAESSCFVVACNEELTGVGCGRYRPIAEIDRTPEISDDYGTASGTECNVRDRLGAD